MSSLEPEMVMKIAQIMKSGVEVCRVDETLAAAASRMWKCDVGCLPVVDASGQVVGMITDHDICVAALMRRQPLQAISVSTAMTSEVVSCSPDATLAEAEQIMRSGQVRRLPVVDTDGALVGIVSLNDLARLVEQQAIMSRLVLPGRPDLMRIGSRRSSDAGRRRHRALAGSGGVG